MAAEFEASNVVTVSHEDGNTPREPVKYLTLVGDGSNIPPAGEEPPHDGNGRRDGFHFRELRLPAALAVPLGIAIGIAVGIAQNLPVK